MAYKFNVVKFRESWILCFVLGMVMLNYPFLHIFNKTTTFFGIPALILYFFIGWPISIGVIYFFSKLLEQHEPEEVTEETPEEEGS
jgi:predicted membrane protein